MVIQLQFNLCDFRKNEDKTPQDYVKIFFKNNIKTEVVLVGHSIDGNNIYGVTADEIIPNEDVYLIWIYCCHSANYLCEKITDRGYLTIGYVRKILTFSYRIPIEVSYVEKNIKSLMGEKIEFIEAELKQKMFECAKKEIKKGEFLLAAILNYNRLSMKVFQK